MTYQPAFAPPVRSAYGAPEPTWYQPGYSYQPPVARDAYSAYPASFYQSYQQGVEYYHGQSSIAEHVLRLSPKDLNDFASDHLSSMHLQEFLRKSGRSAGGEAASVVQKLAPHTVNLAADPIGNYVTQAVLEISDDTLFSICTSGLLSAIYELSVHPHGTRVIQKVISETYLRRAQPALLDRLINALEPLVARLAIDTNGCYVVMRALECIPGGWLFKALLGNSAPEIACERWGVVTIKRVIDTITGEESAPDRCENDPTNVTASSAVPSCLPSDSFRSSQGYPEFVPLLLDSFTLNMESLCRDAFGNYAMQHLLQSRVMKSNQGRDALYRMAETVDGKFLALATHKYSSNLMELLVQTAGDKLIGSVCKDVDVLRDLVIDKYGHYVLLKCLNTASGNVRDEVLNVLAPVIGDLMKSKDERDVKMAKKLLQRHPMLKRRRT